MPETNDVLLLLAEVDRLYALGGASSPGDGEGASPADRWHGAVLAELDDVGNVDPERFAAVARECGLDNAAGLRALVRLSSARAVSAALRYALGMPDPATGEPAGRSAVLDEVNCTHWWLGTGP